MEINNKKLLCALSVIALVVIIIQLNLAFGSNLEGNDNSSSVLENNQEIDKQKNQTNSINTNTNNRVIAGLDITVYEGEPISLKPIISNAIALPAKSLIYSWNQIEGPKINLAEEDKKNKILNFIAPNLPSDTRYVFEVRVVQKNPNGGNIDLGKDTINILVIDINKIAKGAGMNIPLTSSSPSPSSPSSSSSPSSPPPPPNISNNNGDVVVDAGKFNPNFRDGYQTEREGEK